jgi:hypothetical protein
MKTNRKKESLDQVEMIKAQGKDKTREEKVADRKRKNEEKKKMKD